MERPEQLSAALCDEEVVDYFAGRYHTTPREVVRSFLAGEGLADPGDSCRRLCFEENELAILRDLAASLTEAGRTDGESAPIEQTVP